MADTISIIVPVYNWKQNLEAALECLISQKHRELEVIVVDDASTDGSADVIAEYVRKDNRFKSISFPENRGVYQARLAGIRSATGKFTGFLDADDTCSESMFAEMYRQAETNDADLVECNFDVVSDDRIPREYARPRAYCKGFSPKPVLQGREVFQSLLNPRSWHAVWNKLFRTDMLQSAVELLPQTVRLDRCEDLLLCGAFCQFARKAIYIPGKLYHYHRGDSSLTQVLSAEEIRAYIKDDILALGFCEQRLWEDERECFEAKKTAHIRAVLGYVREYGRTNPSGEFRKLLDCVVESYGGVALLALECDPMGVSGKCTVFFHLMAVLKLCRKHMGAFLKKNGRGFRRKNIF